ncbi:LacI family DNA-binding transcriptional regulator [Bifidobacterium phasiani]|uniref:LacI family DNA-binding transcriptional regulator n=1 Tax=Bifidobacterium phasiani TaxID=2834431 RepID=A0ABS6W6X1_9BIFI|nr:LacI family DNA-binding transcriptional regulator [Bifidobacterium phasiani]MBW3082241.1 LacI family DNA-binding transcriptional regulator [Bifidobacterium phasiani]
MASTTTNRRGGRSTRADVARLAGVSDAVVSYVLNGNDRKVSDATAARVREAAAKLDYRPNTIARALKTGSLKMLGMIIPEITNPHFAELINAIEAEAMRRDRTLVLNLSHSDAATERDRVNQLFDRGVDALFFSPAQTDAELGDLIRQGRRIVALDRIYPMPGLKSVVTDFADATRTMTAHLLGHGYRRMVMLFGDAADSPDPRLQGWNAAHQEAGLPTGRIVQSFFTREDAYRATSRLLDDADARPDAVFAASDLEAIGALRAIHEHGLRVPEDIALVSFDGTEETLYSWPQLTTMRQDIAALARHAVNAAIDPDSEPDLRLIPAELVVRHSCGC